MQLRMKRRLAPAEKDRALSIATIGATTCAVTLLVALILMTDTSLDVGIRGAVMRLRASMPESVETVLWMASKLIEKSTNAVASFLIATAVGMYFALRRQDWRPAVLLIGIVVSTLAATTALKVVFERPSPAQWVQGYGDGRAFPSGHAAQALAVWGFIAYLWKKHDTGTRSVVIACLVGLVAVGSGVTRVILDAHWATDVLGGWAVGGSFLCVAVAVTELAHADRASGRLRRGSHPRSAQTESRTPRRAA